MKKLYVITILFIALAVSGCKKEPSSEHPSSEDPADNEWSNPECPAENSLLRSMIVINGEDTSITDYSYDDQNRLIETRSRSRGERINTVEYVDENKYIVYSYNHDTVSSSAHVYLASDGKMDSVLMYAPGESYVSTKNYYKYDSRKRRTGFEQHTFSGPESEGHLFTTGTYDWDAENNIIEATFADPSQAPYAHYYYEYFENVKSYLYQVTEPYSGSGFFFGYPLPENTGVHIVSANLPKRRYNEGGSISFTPEFDMGDRLIKNTETSYDALGNITKTISCYFLYSCK